ncbi:class I adenylate-forming enzyme family protein [Actinomycetospora sp. TBRC 11914]|uniref:class I adenylate-forming enzyme family protein n=1 Tax=Actinomycetospora sp. TBRC 11914 TaxID=2729387 RepID=UPI00145E5A36|nr:AMP-binding protein [Actinomycetospora sp. TBRC 11914]NMO91636.1 long-chain fatty acid--CoA ligase [Actinomycetospora sp. TBRC 11914]
MTELVTDGLAAWAIQAPDRNAVVFDGHDAVTYRDLDRWTDAAAQAHRRSGLAPGDRIGILGDNSLEWIVAAIGALKLGAVVVPLNSRFTADELRYLLEDSGATHVLSDEAHREVAETAAGGTGAATAGLASFTALRGEEAPERVPRPDAGPDDVTQIVYTSGTTSRPKGVIFSHRSTFNLIADFAMAEPALRPGARIIYLLSMSGAPGLLWHILHPLTRGLTIYYERGFDAPVSLRRLAEERIQIIAGVPVLFEQMAARPEFADADLSAIELATIAGAPARTSTIRAWLDKGVPLRQAYGMTELGGISSVNAADQALTRPESFGRGTVFTRHRVVRPDGTDCDAEEPGEIIVSGPGVTPGYWNNAAAYADAMREGWFHSGDVGVRDAEGFIRVVDRMKDMIITGGYNVAPSEIEAAVLELEGVHEVCVIGVDDPKFGETPAAVVYADAAVTAEAVTEHCWARLARYKVPRRVVLTDGPLERMASGKIARRAIRATYAERAVAQPTSA